LGGDHIREDDPPVPNDGRAGLVAGGLDPEDQRHFSSFLTSASMSQRSRSGPVILSLAITLPLLSYTSTCPPVRSASGQRSGGLASLPEAVSSPSMRLS